ncbi:MAG: putative bifunctional diguanylate cyclase/phosphodiesterase [Oleiphilus sp.]
MTNHTVPVPLKKSDLSRQRDAADLLYSNSIAGILITAVAASALVLGFDNSSMSDFKSFWLLAMLMLLSVRLLDSLHWHRRIKGTLYNGKQAIYRFVSGTLLSSVLWAVYTLNMLPLVDIIELACMIIVVSAMAGGSATVLAAHKPTAMLYVFVMLVPMSLGMLLSEQAYQHVLGVLGLSFSVVMVITSKKAADFTAQAILLKHENVELVNHMEEQVAARTQKIYELSNIDPLTGLFNRSAFLNEAQNHLQKTSKDSQTLALLFIDLDGFKKVNDSIGHSVGDQVLRQTAQRLKQLAEEKHLLCRWGGDEFLVMLSGMDEAQVVEKSKAIIQHVSEPYEIDANKITIGATIGVAFYPQHARNEVELIQLADTAMYYQKKRRPSTVGVFSDELGYKITREQKLKTRLNEALENKELRLVYQPIIETQTQTIFAFEALLRWQLDGEAIAPEEFISIAEQYGQIRKIGAWVIRESCLAAKRWQMKHAQCRDIGVSINVSVIQMQEENFVDIVQRALTESGIAPGHVYLEITESMFASDLDKMLRQVTTLQSMGVKVSIDDFGTGYSSLSVMQDLAVNLVKIDQSFIQKIETKGQPIINAVMNISDGLDFRVVAEGVESPEQMAQLALLGVDYLQGYHLARPLEEDDLDDFFKQ